MNADTVLADDPAAPVDTLAVVPTADLGDTVVTDAVDLSVTDPAVRNPGEAADTVSVQSDAATPPPPSVPSVLYDGDTVIVDGVGAQVAGLNWQTLPVEGSVGADDYYVIVTPNGLAKARSSAANPASGGNAVVSAGYMTGDDVIAHRALVFDSSGLAIHAQPNSGRYVFVGIAATSVTSGMAVEALVSGVLNDSTWGWVKGLPIFVTNNGVLTQIEPTTGVRHQVGVALSDTSIFISPQPPTKAGATILTVEAGIVTQRPLARLTGIAGALDDSVAPYTELYGGNF